MRVEHILSIVLYTEPVYLPLCLAGTAPVSPSGLYVGIYIYRAHDSAGLAWVGTYVGFLWWMDSTLGDSKKWFALPFTVHAGAGWMDARWRMTDEEEEKQTMDGWALEIPNQSVGRSVYRSMTKRDLYFRSHTPSVIYAVGDRFACRINENIKYV